MPKCTIQILGKTERVCERQKTERQENTLAFMSGASALKYKTFFNNGAECF